MTNIAAILAGNLLPVMDGVLRRKILLASLQCALMCVGYTGIASAEKVDLDKTVATSLRFDGRAVSCFMARASAVAGLLSKKQFTNLKIAFNAKKKKLGNRKSDKKKLLVLKRQLAAAVNFCSDIATHPLTPTPSVPAVSPTGIPVPTPTPIPNAQPLSLERYDGSFGLEEIRHLLRRTTYGPSAEDVAKSQQLGLDGTIDWLLQDGTTPDLDEEVSHLKDGDPDADHDYENPEGARMVFMTYARKSPYQFKERMAMFWHDLFAASHRVLDWGEMHFIFEYMDICRNEALGNAKRLAQAMTTNGMMLTWLDGRLNRSGMVNENYAREFWELFSLGIGNYTEHDVHESARSLTGWTVVWQDETNQFEVVYAPSRRDTGTKVIFENTPYEQRGNFGAEDIVRLTYDVHPAAPRHLAKALFNFLVGTDPDASTTQALAALLKANDYELKPVLRTILQSKAFFAPQVRFDKIRTPFTYLISFFRTSGLPWDLWDMLDYLRSSGQDVMNPPSVKGWDDNAYWLNQQWLLTRMNLPTAAFNYVSWRFSPFSYQIFANMHPQSFDALLEQVASRLQVQIPVEVLPKLKNYLATTVDWDEVRKPNTFDAQDTDEIEKKIRGLMFILAELPTMQRE